MGVVSLRDTLGMEHDKDVEHKDLENVHEVAERSRIGATTSERVGLA